MSSLARLRRLHLHLGVFFTPLLLFFVLTGWYQTVSPDRRKGGQDSDDLLSRMTRVHVDQYYPSKSAEGYSTKGFTTLVVAMSGAATLTILLGVYLAFRSMRNPWLVVASLVLGILLPVLILRLSQTR